MHAFSAILWYVWRENFIEPYSKLYMFVKDSDKANTKKKQNKKI